MMKTVNKHEFALYFEKLSHVISPTSPVKKIMLNDETLCHRIAKVLRLAPGETITLFDHQHHALFTIDDITKKAIQLILISQKKNKSFTPAITFLLPLLKRTDLESALYSLVEIGVTTIQLVSTQKTAKELWSEKELHRLRNVMIAAAEQSKNFALPHLKKPIPLAHALANVPSPSSFIYFDPSGKPLLEIMNSLSAKKPHDIVLMVGPEGDLVSEEKELIKNYHAEFCALTPTILRAVQAVAISAGVFRSTL